MAVLTGAVLAAAAACSGTAGGGGGTSTGSAPPSRTLTPTPAPDSGAHPAAAWPTYGRDVARSDVAAGVATPGPLNGELAGAPGRRGLRPAAAGRRHGDRGDRGRLGLRARSGDRAGDLAQARRHPGAAVGPAVRQHRPARHHRHAGLQPGQRARLRRGRDLGIPPRAGRDLGARRQRPGTSATFPPRTGSRGTTSSGPRSPSAPGGCTWRSAGCTETAVLTAARWWASRSAAAGR